LDPHPLASSEPDEVRVDGALFRDAMSRVAGAVHVVTTGGPQGRGGFTATAVASVSDRPATLLVCANAASRSAERLVANGAFCVNTLAWEDEPLASVFAGRGDLKGEDRFRLGRWTTLATGSPALASSLVSFDCRVVDARPVATHLVVVGEVAAVRVGLRRRALIYRERAFQGL